MTLDDALDTIAKYEHEMPLPEDRYTEVGVIPEELVHGDRVYVDGAVVFARDYVQAKSVIRRWESTPVPGKSGVRKSDNNLRAEGFAMALIEHFNTSKDAAAKIGADRYNVKPSTIRRILTQST
jgi:hypothetical protein